MAEADSQLVPLVTLLDLKSSKKRPRRFVERIANMGGGALDSFTTWKP